MTVVQRTERLGFVIALRDEALALASGRWQWGACRPVGDAGAVNHHAMWCGPGTQAATDAAEALIAAGCTRLVSWGVAGGLDPDVVAGDLMLAEQIVSGDQMWTCAKDWLRSESLASAVACVGGTLVSASAVVTDVAVKAELYAQTHARAVDMESAAVAAVANRHGIACSVVRAIADDAQHGLPPAVCSAIGDNGQPRLLRLMWALLSRPSEWRLLPGTQRRYQAALATLRLVAPLALTGCELSVEKVPQGG